MKKNLLSLVIVLLSFFSCTKETVTSEGGNPFTRDQFLAMSLKEQFAAMVKWGGITKIDIHNLDLQRISTGTVRNFPQFAFNYCPVIDIFELNEQSPGTYSMGLRKGGPAGQVLDVAVILKEGNDPWVEVNGLRYNVQLNGYTAGDGKDMVEYTFTPTGAVPGTSDNYLNLISALNNSNNGDAIRPGLPISDLRVLSLGSLRLTVLLDTDGGEQLPVLGTCQEVAPQGGFLVEGDGIYEYNSGKGTVIKIHDQEINDSRSLTVTVTYNEKYTVQFWGDDGRMSGPREPFASHENLNGKHIKDRLGDNRTLITPDGTKITIVSSGPYRAASAITIYNGGSVHHINIGCTKLEYSAANNPFISQRMDELQPDGETSMLEDTPDTVWFYNIYNEDTPCNRVYERVNLGSLPKANENQVNDLYDDPRLAHT